MQIPHALFNRFVTHMPRYPLSYLLLGLLTSWRKTRHQQHKYTCSHYMCLFFFYLIMWQGPWPFAVPPARTPYHNITATFKLLILIVMPVLVMCTTACIIISKQSFPQGYSITIMVNPRVCYCILISGDSTFKERLLHNSLIRHKNTTFCLDLEDKPDVSSQ